MLTILSQNIWGGGPLWRRRRASLARRVAQLEPDVIGLQEVHARGDASQAHELADLLTGYGVVFAPARVETSGHCEGLALLSRRPVREFRVRRLTHHPRDIVDRFGPRVVLQAAIELPDETIDVLVTHLSLSRPARRRTIPELLASAPSGGAVLMGDFNAEPSELALLETNGWLDAWTCAHRPSDPGGTWPSVAPLRRLDYIFVRPAGHWRVHACDREPASGSDHLGVMARLAPG